MLNSKPTGAGKKATARWEATNRMTFEIFKVFWQKVSPALHSLTMFPGEASYNEWEDGNYKYQGMRKPGGDQKHGIVRKIMKKGGWIKNLN